MPIEPGPASVFLEFAGWGAAIRKPLAGDASSRRYERLNRAGETAILMIVPPENRDQIHAFLRVGRHLSSIGLTTPRIIARAPSDGLLLIEDLGDDLFACMADAETGLETTMYRAAVEVLAHLHAQPTPKWAVPYDQSALAELVAPAFDWYAGTAASKAVKAELVTLFNETPGLTDVLILRDYHAENLIWRPAEQGLARTGILDFQDAMAGHRAYDLVSLIEDARRDLSPGLGSELMDQYLDLTGVAEVAFRRAYALLGAQRNLRILGVFARLAVRDGRPGYVSMIPRVWAHLQNDLSHPALARLRGLLDSQLPPPDTAQLESLKDTCAPTQS
ncbi:MAG: phosphotransferase [Pseudomonadota bacterium]